MADSPAWEAQFVMRMNLCDDAPEGAGWYIYVNSPGAALIAPRRIAASAAKKLAQAFSEAFAGDIAQDAPAPLDIIDSGNRVIHQALQQQLGYAEEQARRVGSLRRLLSFEEETLTEES